MRLHGQAIAEVLSSKTQTRYRTNTLKHKHTTNRMYNRCCNNEDVQNIVQCSFQSRCCNFLG